MLLLDIHGESPRLLPVRPGWRRHAVACLVATLLALTAAVVGY